LWEEQGWDGLDGIAWYRSSFELSADEAKAGIRLGLGTIDDSDTTWVNGPQVGRTEWAWTRARVYDVPPAALRPGRNVSPSGSRTAVAAAGSTAAPTPVSSRPAASGGRSLTAGASGSAG
jgi:sialate O-acetylesterase